MLVARPAQHRGAGRAGSDTVRTSKGPLLGSGSVRLVYGSWQPDGASHAVVVLVHGIGEHMGRYAHVCAALVERGYAVLALDHRGHGASEGRRGSIRYFDDFVDDLHLVVQRAAELHAGLPIFMLGHSLGGLIAVRYTLRHGDQLAGLVLSGPALHVGDDAPALLRKLSRVLAALAPNLPIVPVAKGTGLLSRDPAIDQAFRDDPLCYRGKVRARMGYEILRASADACARFAEIYVPLLIMHGAADRVTNPSGSAALYQAARSIDKTLKLWPDSRHEIFNELDKRDVLDYMLDWLDARRLHLLPAGALTTSS